MAGHEDPFKKSARVERSPPGSAPAVLGAESIAPSLPPPPGLSRVDSSGSVSSMGSAKRSRAKEDDEEVEELVEGVFKKPKAVQKFDLELSFYDVLALLDSSANKLNKASTEKLKMGFKSMMGRISELESQNMYLQGRLDERKVLENTASDLRASAASFRKTCEQGPPAGARTSSWAQIAGGSSGPPKIIDRIPQEKTPVIFIKPAEGKRESKVIREEIKAALDPVKEGLKIRGVRPAGDGRIVVEAGDWITIEKIKKSKALADKGLSVSDENKRSPRVILYDVDTSFSVSDLVESVFEQNIDDMSLENFKKAFRPVFKRGRKEGSKVHHVIETTPELRKILIEKGRLFVSWFSCRVEDFAGLSRCFKCQEFGHVAKFCKGNDVCKHCGKSGHKVSDCPTPEGGDVCAPCKNRKLAHDHLVGSKDCITYSRGVDALLKRTNYG